MPEAKPQTSEEGSDEQSEVLEGDALDLDGLKKRGDVKGLLTLAKAYRAGSAPGGRDMKRCYAAYQAAAELGSPEAEYAVALFTMTGGVVAQDLKEGATRLRSAAEKGSVPAKVYLGNLYELGIQYKADPEKADVWYRNAARGARVEEEVGSDEYAMALAELGCVRYVLALVEAGTASGDDKTRLLQRARAHGYGLKQKDDSSSGVSVMPSGGDRPTFLDALSNAEKSAAKTENAVIEQPGVGGVAPPLAERQRANTSPETKSAKDKLSVPPPKPVGPTRTSIALGAFGYALLFAIAGVGAGYAATLGAVELVAHGKSLPGLGTKAHLVFPIVLGIVGVLPTWLVYRLGTVIKAIVIGGAFAGIGWVAWGTGVAAMHGNRPIQALSFGLAGFLAGIFVLGLIGGTKKQPPRVPRKHSA